MITIRSNYIYNFVDTMYQITGGITSTFGMVFSTVSNALYIRGLNGRVRRSPMTISINSTSPIQSKLPTEGPTSGPDQEFARHL